MSKTKEMVEKVDAMVKSGEAKSASAACKILKVNTGSYYGARSKMKGKPSKVKNRARARLSTKVKVIDLPQHPIQSSSRLVMIIGSVNDVLSAAKGMVS